MQSCGNISRALGHCHRETTHLVAFLGISFKGYLKMCGVFRTTFQSNVGYFSVVQSLNRVWLFGTLWTAGHQAPLSSTISWSLLILMSIESVMPSNQLVLCLPHLLLPSIFHSIRVLLNESALRIRWPNYWSFSFVIRPSNEHSGLTSFRTDWFDLLAVQGTQESSLAPLLESINSLALSLLYGPTLISIHDYWKNHSFDNMDLCGQSDVSAF